MMCVTINNKKQNTHIKLICINKFYVRIYIVKISVFLDKCAI